MVGSIVPAYLFFVFYYRFSFNYEIGMNDQYKLVFALPVAAAVLGLARPERDRRWLGVVLPGVAMALGLLLLLSDRYSFANEHGWVVAACGLLAMGMFWLPGKEIVIAFFVAVFVVQLCLGSMQLYGAMHTGQDSTRLLQGSLQNSGVFDCYLVIQLPLAIWLAHKYPGGKAGRIIGVAVAVVAIGLMVAAGSRTACIALAATAAAGIWGCFGKRIGAVLKTWPSVAIWGLGLTGAAAAALGAYVLFGMKRMSAMGRLLKLQVAGAHWADHFWWGTGPGRFSWYYPYWQAAYFRDTPEPPASFVMSAGESYILFNEYVQLFEETGIAGLGTFTILMIVVLTAKSERHKALLLAVKLTVVAVLCCGFTAYPFHVNAFTFLFIVCCVLSFRLRENRLLPRLPMPIPGRLLRVYVWIAVFALLTPFYRGVRELHAVYCWQQLGDKAQEDEEAGNAYAVLYPVLRHNGKFLTDYGQWLAQDKDRCGQAVIVLEQAKASFTSRKTMEATAAAYAQLGQFDMAARHRAWVCQFLPNRFRPRYELLKTYQAMGDTQKVRMVAQDILRMPVKIPSAEVYDVQEAARTALIKRSENDLPRQEH